MAPDYDPRIVELYDEDNPDGPDHDYYRALASKLDAKRILDLGCGTGILTVTLAGQGRTVIGADPSAAMMAYAKQRPGAEAISWINGDAAALGDGCFDLMVMTGNVAQHIPDPHWEQTLKILRAAAARGSVLAFESRNPAARAWETWALEEPRTRDTRFGPLTEWNEVEEGNAGQVLLRSFNKFEQTGEVVIEELNLAFRSAQTIRGQLAEAGFALRATWADWLESPFEGEQPLMVFEAEAV